MINPKIVIISILILFLFGCMTVTEVQVNMPNGDKIIYLNVAKKSVFGNNAEVIDRWQWTPPNEDNKWKGDLKYLKGDSALRSDSPLNALKSLPPFIFIP